MLTIPDPIRDAARRGGAKSPKVTAWLKSVLDGAGVSRDASPADWPQEVWDAYCILRDTQEPPPLDSARRLFEELGIPDGS